MRLALSILAAAALHGAVLGVAAVVLSGESAESPAQPVAIDVDVMEVTAPKPDPVADFARGAAPSPSMVPAVLHRRTREPSPPHGVALAGNPATPDSAAAADAPGPSVLAPAPGVAAPRDAAPASRGTAGAATGAGSTISAQPRYRTNPLPEYPLASRRRQEEGIVLLNVVVQADGRPAAITLNRSSGHPLLDRAALDVVRGWTFEPARAAGVPVSSLVVVPVRFSLSDGP